MNTPQAIILAGPNGAGKSTSAPELLRDTFAVTEFVSADAIAQGLSAFAPENSAAAAGRIMLRRLRELAEKKLNFAFETALAARSFLPWLKDLMSAGYQTHLLFLSLPNAEMAVERVARRVSLGGHSIPESVIKRRFEAGLENFFRLYRRAVSSWQFYDNSFPGGPYLAARRTGSGEAEIRDSLIFERFLKEYGHGQQEKTRH
jgi:predicted ABC-type ATPase